MAIENSNDYYSSFSEVIYNAEQERRKINKENIGTYGINIVNEFTCGILPSELVVVGSDTGLGKTELAYSIAIENAKKGKKVLLFALEGDVNEIGLRYLQKEIAVMQEVKTAEFRTNTDESLQEHSDTVINEVGSMEWSNNLKIFNKKEIPTFDFLKEMIETSSEYFDMFIIDHLHYIQFGDRAREIEEIGKVMRGIKTLTDIHKKPVILMSHLRKRSGEKDPTQWDLYGSSNIAKEATTILLISRMELNTNKFFGSDPKNWDGDGHKRYSGTKLIIEKSRAGMPVPTKLACVYDRRGKCYVEKRSHLIEDDSQAGQEDALKF